MIRVCQYFCSSNSCWCSQKRGLQLQNYLKKIYVSFDKIRMNCKAADSNFKIYYSCLHNLLIKK